MEKILCVDDEPHVLEAFQRQLRKRFDLDSAAGGPEALERIRSNGPYAVIVADMNMPGMNGVQLLAKVREAAPDTVRIMLTGVGDFQTALHAVNEGNVFRFIAKPCPAETLATALDAGLAQYRLVHAERELLEKTLKGSIQAMADILAATHPVAFSRALRLRDFCAQMAASLRVPDAWQVEVAALLSQIGCVTLPAEVLEKAFAGETLSPQEAQMFDAHPHVGAKLIDPIPRMEKVAFMISRQHQTLAIKEPFSPSDPAEESRTGAFILQAAMDFDLLLARGLSAEKAKGTMRGKTDRFPALVLEALVGVDVPELEKIERMANIDQLRLGMTLAEDLRTKTGVLVVQKNQEVNETLRQRLQNFQKQRLIPDQVRVYVCRREARSE
jgi:CheY-like chemotaxis protein